MFKIIPLKNNKGFAYSPFVAAALIVIGLSLATFFAETESVSSAWIRMEGRLSRSAIDLEEEKQAFASYAVVCAESFLEDDQDASEAELEHALEEKLNARLRNHLGASGSFSLSVDALPGNRFAVRTAHAPTFCVVSDSVRVCSIAGFERVVGYG